MPTFAFAALGFARSHWKLIIGGLLVLALVVQTLRLDASQERAERYKAQGKALQSQLDDLAAKSKAQQADTAKRIDRIVKRDDSEARKVETAPLEPGCKTPRAILEADL